MSPGESTTRPRWKAREVRIERENRGGAQNAWRASGGQRWLFEPQELIEKLAALVPPPRFHLVRYHGILGPCASERDRVVPGAGPAQEQVRPPPGKQAVDIPVKPRRKTAGQGHERDSFPDRCNPLGQEGKGATPTRSGLEEPLPASDEPALRPRRLAWADLVRRVFAVVSDAGSIPAAFTKFLLGFGADLDYSNVMAFEGAPQRKPFGQSIKDFVPRDSRDERRKLLDGFWFD